MTEPVSSSDRPAETVSSRPIEVVLIVAPALDEEAAQLLRDEVGEVLAERYPSVEWELRLIRDGLLDPPARLTELIDAARDRLLAEDAELVVVVTDLPLRLGRRPLLSHASPTHGVALVSLPALGVLKRGRRLRDAVADALGA